MNGVNALAGPGRKAIVNVATQRVLGIVGRDYTLVTNRQALEWAYECCRSVFPDTAAAEWDVSAADGPATGGYCRIDLVHRTARLDFGDVDLGNGPRHSGRSSGSRTATTGSARSRSILVSIGRSAGTV